MRYTRVLQQVTSAPSYVTTNRLGIFYFQYRVPTHFQQSGISRRLFRKSLHTRDRRLALKLARRWAVGMDDLAKRFFATPEAFGKAMELLMRYKGIECASWDTAESLLMELDDAEVDLLMHAVDYDTMRQKAGFDLIEQNELLRRMVDVLHDRLATTSSKPTSTHQADVPRLSQLIEKYIKHVSFSWDKRHYEGNLRDLRPRLDTLLEIIGDKQCNTITCEDVSRFREVTSRLPANRKKKATYREKTIDELVRAE